MNDNIKENIDRLLDNNQDRITLYNTDSIFCAAINVLARDGDIVDLLCQICKNSSEVAKRFQDHIMICPMPQHKF